MATKILIYNSLNVNSLMKPLINLSCHHQSKKRVFYINLAMRGDHTNNLNNTKNSSIKTHIHKCIFYCAGCQRFKLFNYS